MSKIILVDDPLYAGDGPAPQMPRAWAMKRLYEVAKMTVSDIAKKYRVDYHLAYKAVHTQTSTPKPEASPRVDGRRKPAPAPEILSTLTKSQLLKGVTAKIPNGDVVARARVEAYAAELDRRFPGWGD